MTLEIDQQAVDVRPHAAELLLGPVSLAVRVPAEAGQPDAWRLSRDRLEVLRGQRVVAERTLDPLGVGLLRRRCSVVCVLDNGGRAPDYLTLGRIDMPAEVA